MSFTTPAKSLDLLRQNIQRSVNQDIRNVITKYMEVSEVVYSTRCQAFVFVFMKINQVELESLYWERKSKE